MYDGPTRSGGFIMADWICTSITDAPEVLPWQRDYVLYHYVLYHYVLHHYVLYHYYSRS